MYRLALHLLPPGFRHAYGAALEQEARARLDEASPGWPRRVAGAVLAADLVGAMVREWWDVLSGMTVSEWGGAMGADMRLAFRTLVRAPVFALTVVLTLALGIGASTVSLGLVDTYLLRSLPYPNSERLVSVWHQENWSRRMMDMARAGFPSLEGVAGTNGVMLVLEGSGDPEELYATQATTNLFDILGVTPALGRGFTASDGKPGSEPVTILSHHLWVERFGSDASVLGRSIALGGDGHLRRTVVGVMPDGYLPLQGRGVDAWVPVVTDPTAEAYGNSYFLQAVGRLKPGATPSHADRDLRAFAQRVHEMEPGWFTEERIRQASALPLGSERSADRRTPVLIALGAALLVLLVACANVASLMVARTIGRERELAVRAALGAGRFRTARSVLTEMATLAGIGGLAGFAVAAGSAWVLERRFPSALPAWGLPWDVRWIVAASVLAAITALAAGLVPALQAARRDPGRAMSGGRRTLGSRRLSRTQELLSGMQLALATAGVTAMVLLGRSLVELSHVDVGYDPTHAITFRLTAPPGAYREDADVVRFFRDVRSSLQQVPGVRAVGFASRLPLSGGVSRTSVQPEGWTFQGDEPRPQAWHRLVTPGYLEALGARLTSGRLPGPEDDRDGTPELVVINRAAAREFWPNQSAVGKRLYGPGHHVWLTVAGVVENIREKGQAGPILPGLYIPHRDWPRRTLYAVVRTRTAPASLLPDLEKAVRATAPGAPMSRTKTLAWITDQGLEAARTLTVLAALAAAVTLLLSALGVYGSVNHSVTRRMPELGVRAALGARGSRLLRGELVGATRVVVMGLGGGLALAWAVARALAGLLHGVAALDPVSFGAAFLVLGSAAYLAAVIPARRAALVDPARVMREDGG